MAKPIAEGQGPNGSSALKGTWGCETAGTDADEGTYVVRALAVPEGGAGEARTDEPRAPAQQPVDLLLIALQLWIRALYGAPITKGSSKGITLPLV